MDKIAPNKTLLGKMETMGPFSSHGIRRPKKVIPSYLRSLRDVSLSPMAIKLFCLVSQKSEVFAVPRKTLRVVVLDRPEALNSLNLSMIQKIDNLLSVSA